jgi:hypothetical protein
MPMTRFPAPWDGRLRAASWIFGGILTALAAGLTVLGLAISGGELDLLWPFLIGPVIIAAVMAGAWLLAPRGYALQGPELVVLRRLWPIRIPLAEIRAVGRLSPEDVACSLRLGGNGGLFGHYGQFWNRGLGSFRMYATRRSGLVRVETGTEVFVLSPGDPEAFVDAVLARAPGAQRGSSGQTSASVRPAALRVMRGMGIGLAVLLLLVGCLFGGIWAFAPLGVEVTGDAVRIERRWAGPVQLPLSRIRSAEVLASQYGRRWWRTNGTAMGRTRFGRFASRELGPFRLYAWRYGPYVLLETEEGRVVLTPDDPQRFVDQVRERIRAAPP